VVHAAAHLGGGARALHARVNAGGTDLVCSACAAADVRRLVHVSTIAVHGWQPRGTTVAPEDAAEPLPERRDDYAWSKIQAERWVRLHRAAHGLDAVVLRLGIVHGAGRAPLGRVVRRLPGGVLLAAGAPWARLPLVHVDDVADAVARALTIASAPATPLAVVGPDQPTHADWLAALARRGEAPARVVWLPLAPARWLAAVGVTRDHAAASRAYALAWTCQGVRYDTAPTRRALGWTPTRAALDGAAATRVAGPAPTPAEAC